MNHEVVCGNDREVFVTIIEGSVHCLFISLLVQPVHLPQINKWALSHEFKLVPFHVLHVYVLFKTNGVSFILSCLFQYNTSAMRSEF